MGQAPCKKIDPCEGLPCCNYADNACRVPDSDDIMLLLNTDPCGALLAHHKTACEARRNQALQELQDELSRCLTKPIDDLAFWDDVMTNGFDANVECDKESDIDSRRADLVTAAEDTLGCDMAVAVAHCNEIDGTGAHKHVVASSSKTFEARYSACLLSQGCVATGCECTNSGCLDCKSVSGTNSKTSFVWGNDEKLQQLREAQLEEREADTNRTKSTQPCLTGLQWSKMTNEQVRRCTSVDSSTLAQQQWHNRCKAYAESLGVPFSTDKNTKDMPLGCIADGLPEYPFDYEAKTFGDVETKSIDKMMFVWEPSDDWEAPLGEVGGTCTDDYGKRENEASVTTSAADCVDKGFRWVPDWYSLCLVTDSSEMNTGGADSDDFQQRSWVVRDAEGNLSHPYEISPTKTTLPELEALKTSMSDKLEAYRIQPGGSHPIMTMNIRVSSPTMSPVDCEWEKALDDKCHRKNTQDTRNRCFEKWGCNNATCTKEPNQPRVCVPPAVAGKTYPMLKINADYTKTDLEQELAGFNDVMPTCDAWMDETLFESYDEGAHTKYRDACVRASRTPADDTAGEADETGEAGETGDADETGEVDAAGVDRIVYVTRSSANDRCGPVHLEEARHLLKKDSAIGWGKTEEGWWRTDSADRGSLYWGHTTYGETRTNKYVDHKWFSCNEACAQKKDSRNRAMVCKWEPYERQYGYNCAEKILKMRYVLPRNQLNYEITEYQPLGSFQHLPVPQNFPNTDLDKTFSSYITRLPWQANWSCRCKSTDDGLVYRDTPVSYTGGYRDKKASVGGKRHRNLSESECETFAEQNDMEFETGNNDAPIGCSILGAKAVFRAKDAGNLGAGVARESVSVCAEQNCMGENCPTEKGLIVSPDEFDNIMSNKATEVMSNEASDESDSSPCTGKCAAEDSEDACRDLCDYEDGCYVDTTATGKPQCKDLSDIVYANTREALADRTFVALKNNGGDDSDSCKCVLQTNNDGLSRVRVECVSSVKCDERFTDPNDYRGCQTKTTSGKTCLPWNYWKDEINFQHVKRWTTVPQNSYRTETQALNDAAKKLADRTSAYRQYSKCDRSNITTWGHCSAAAKAIYGGWIRSTHTGFKPHNSCYRDNDGRGVIYLNTHKHGGGSNDHDCSGKQCLCQSYGSNVTSRALKNQYDATFEPAARTFADEQGLGDHNYCRSPGDSNGLWCYTADGWEDCVPRDTQHGNWSEWVGYYGDGVYKSATAHLDEKQCTIELPAQSLLVVTDGPPSRAILAEDPPRWVEFASCEDAGLSTCSNGIQCCRAASNGGYVKTSSHLLGLSDGRTANRMSAPPTTNDRRSACKAEGLFLCDSEVGWTSDGEVGWTSDGDFPRKRAATGEWVSETTLQPRGAHCCDRPTQTIEESNWEKAAFWLAQEASCSDKCETCNYKLQSSGQCADDPEWRNITSATECEEGAKALEFGVTTAFVEPSTNSVGGCSKWKGTKGNLVFNSSTDSNVHCSSRNACVCIEKSCCKEKCTQEDGCYFDDDAARVYADGSAGALSCLRTMS